MTYWEWSTFPLEDAMNNSLLPGEGGKTPQGYWTKSSFLSSLKKKKVYKVLSAFCILCHWSSDNWLCLGGSLLDMLRLSSGKRYSSKLSLPSQGIVRQNFTDLKGHGEIEITLWGKKFHSEVLSQLATLPPRICSFKWQIHEASFRVIFPSYILLALLILL